MSQSNKKNKTSNSSLEGVLERITFYNEENGFLIGKLRENDKSAEIAVIGKAPKIQCGETLILKGNWTNHPKHGKQFSFDKLPIINKGHEFTVEGEVVKFLEND